MLKALEVVVTSTFETEVEDALSTAGVGDNDVRGFSTAVDTNGATKVHILYAEESV